MSVQRAYRSRTNYDSHRQRYLCICRSGHFRRSRCAHYDRGRRARVQGRRDRHRSPWSRPTPKDANIAGGYLTITNKGKTADRLIGGASPSASQIEVHEVVDVDGMTKTRPLANGIEIKPGKTVELKPGSYRILLLGLKEPFQLGQKVKGTLVFEKAGPVEIVYNVEENAGAAVSGVAQQHKHH
ncbi:copper chaperone PCu(A)C [Bradyrhizobium sp. RDT10]